MCGAMKAAQTLTVDHHLVGGFGAADGVLQPARVLPVVLLLQRVDPQPANVGGEQQAAAGGQRLLVLQPRGARRAAGRRPAADVGGAVAGDEDGGRTADLSTRDGLCGRQRKASFAFHQCVFKTLANHVVLLLLKPPKHKILHFP